MLVSPLQRKPRSENTKKERTDPPFIITPLSLPPGSEISKPPRFPSNIETSAFRVEEDDFPVFRLTRKSNSLGYGKINEKSLENENEGKEILEKFMIKEERDSNKVSSQSFLGIGNFDIRSVKSETWDEDSPNKRSLIEEDEDEEEEFIKDNFPSFSNSKVSKKGRNVFMIKERRSTHKSLKGEDHQDKINEFDEELRIMKEKENEANRLTMEVLNELDVEITRKDMEIQQLRTEAEILKMQLSPYDTDRKNKSIQNNSRYTSFLSDMLIHTYEVLENLSLCIGEEKKRKEFSLLKKMLKQISELVFKKNENLNIQTENEFRELHREATADLSLIIVEKIQKTESSVFFDNMVKSDQKSGRRVDKKSKFDENESFIDLSKERRFSESPVRNTLENELLKIKYEDLYKDYILLKDKYNTTLKEVEALRTTMETLRRPNTLYSRREENVFHQNLEPQAQPQTQTLNIRRLSRGSNITYSPQSVERVISYKRDPSPTPIVPIVNHSYTNEKYHETRYLNNRSKVISRDISPSTQYTIGTLGSKNTENKITYQRIQPNNPQSYFQRTIPHQNRILSNTNCMLQTQNVRRYSNFGEEITNKKAMNGEVVNAPKITIRGSENRGLNVSNVSNLHSNSKNMNVLEHSTELRDNQGKVLANYRDVIDIPNGGVFKQTLKVERVERIDDNVI